MHKSFKYLAMTALASALIAGQATTAFAFKNDSNNGPGAAKTNEVSLQAPSDTSDNSQASGNNDSQTAITEDSSQPAGNSQSETSQTTENASNTTTENTTAAETVTEDTSAQVPTNQAFLQVQLLRASDQVWSDPVRDDSVLSVGDAGFLSMCIYANNLPGACKDTSVDFPEPGPLLVSFLNAKAVVACPAISAEARAAIARCLKVLRIIEPPTVSYMLLSA